MKGYGKRNRQISRIKESRRKDKSRAKLERKMERRKNKGSLNPFEL